MRPNRLIKPVWWARPGPAIAIIVIPVLLLGLFAKFPYRLYSVQDYRDMDGLLTSGIVIGALAVGCLAGRRKRNAASSGVSRPTRILDEAKSLDLLLFIAIASYMALLSPLLLHPASTWSAFLSGQTAAPLRALVDSVPGIRALTQSAIVYATVWAWVTARARLPRRFRHRWGIFAIGALVIFRSLALAERLSFVEFVLPILICISTSPTKKLARRILAFAPLSLPIMFGVFEYFRSWRAGYDRLYDSYPQYVLDRLSSYYVAAANNGAGLQAIFHTDASYRYPISGLLEIPGAESALPFTPSDPLPVFLGSFADPQFNTTTGIYPYIFAYGLVPSMLIFGIIGLVLTVSYRRFTGEYLTRLGILYPTVLVGTLQIPLIAYFSEPRFLAYFLVVVLGTRFHTVESSPKSFFDSKTRITSVA